MPLVQKQPNNVILHVETNDASSSNSSEIVNNILKLRSFISQKLPNANIVLLKPTMRSDTAAGKVTIEEVNKQLKSYAHIIYSYDYFDRTCFVSVLNDINQI